MNTDRRNDLTQAALFRAGELTPLCAPVKRARSRSLRRQAGALRGRRRKICPRGPGPRHNLGACAGPPSGGNGDDGRVLVYRGDDFARLSARLRWATDADNARLDSKGRVHVGYSSAAIAVIDPAIAPREQPPGALLGGRRGCSQPRDEGRTNLQRQGGGHVDFRREFSESV
jgi:hypothetical protein